MPDCLESRRRLGTTGQQIFLRTVSSMFVVIINKFRNKIIAMPLAECDEMVQGFVFNRLHKSIDPGIEIRRADWQPLRLDAFVLQKLLYSAENFVSPWIRQVGFSSRSATWFTNALACFGPHTESGRRVEDITKTSRVSRCKMHKNQHMQIEESLQCQCSLL